MAARKFHNNRLRSRGQDLLKRTILIREKKLIERYFKFLKCSITKNRLKCIGEVKPTEYSNKYKIKVVYNAITRPEVFVVEPEIEYHDDIHMFPKDKALCLYHSETDDFYWDHKKHHLFNTIIPWSLEWFVHYELYLISGKWEHPFKSHRIIMEEI